LKASWDEIYTFQENLSTGSPRRGQVKILYVQGLKQTDPDLNGRNELDLIDGKRKGEAEGDAKPLDIEKREGG
jgi:hypothetical protein